MLSFQSQDLVVSLISVLASLDVVLIGDSGLFLDLANLLLHLDYGILGKENLFAHDVDLCLHILVPPNRIIQVHSLVGKQVVDVATGDLLQVEILLRGYHLLDLILLLIVLGEHLLDLILEYQVPLPLMLQLLCVIIGFSLQALHLGLFEAADLLVCAAVGFIMHHHRVVGHFMKYLYS